MIFVKPYFFDKFSCKADKCTDTCCAGWEVDIDDETYGKYLDISDGFSERLREGIDASGTSPCFRLDKNERCLFLDKNNLCEIYSSLGESYLCEICREHPRFYDFYQGVTEMGLGLACEKVCELMFSSENPVSFLITDDGEPSEPDEDYVFYSAVRNEIFSLIQNRDMDFAERIRLLLTYAVSMQNDLFCEDNSVSDIDADGILSRVIELFKATEPINDEWTDLINGLSSTLIRHDFQTDIWYEQILTYMIYRHFISSCYNGALLSAITFSVASVILIHILNTDIYLNSGRFELPDMINNVKLWSKQIEYSAENTEYVLENSVQIFCN